MRPSPLLNLILKPKLIGEYINPAMQMIEGELCNQFARPYAAFCNYRNDQVRTSIRCTLISADPLPYISEIFPHDDNAPLPPAA